MPARSKQNRLFAFFLLCIKKRKLTLVPLGLISSKQDAHLCKQNLVSIGDERVKNCLHTVETRQRLPGSVTVASMHLMKHLRALQKAPSFGAAFDLT